MLGAVNIWAAEHYRQHAGFVPALGADVLALLDPRPGERILDLGCGEGSLTEKLAASGAVVIGVDNSDDMVRAARARGLDVRHMSAEALTFDEEFDAVFSNAALHWMRDHHRVLSGVYRALRPRGRFVAELGGHGNVAAIHVAVRAVLDRHGMPHDSARYYPTHPEYRARLEQHGFSVEQIRLIPRPTPLPSGMRGWLETFERSTLERLTEADRTLVIQEIENLLRPSLCDTEGRWTADYVRLRFSARKP
jgi:trans-aconitate methyltransferase